MRYETYILKGNLLSEEMNTKLKYSLNAWAEEGFSLHSITPQINEGTTEGYILILSKEENEKPEER
ncbi:DUF4177 domain-containing protein [Bacillus solimangrovi]|uniref:DUF4177 domain-containing protein n=1 Tax=Bacillus solimangrovi TaxID=1305675 RepID=A0A1E5LJ13_9BACI|nr:DUF4177 domain-containing protein [Bacillus solimangrovi]OEH94026.1 hypothetical protein BFG57_10290 [Bacillus solimangrovi]